MDPETKLSAEEFAETLGSGLETDYILDEFEAEDLLGRDIDLDHSGEWG